MRQLFELKSNKEVIEFVEKHGAERSIEKLREKEKKSDLNKLKSSDDAALALLEF